MPTSATTESVRWALEQFIPFWIIGGFGVVLLGLAWWMARQDARHVDKPRFVFVLLGLRCAAIVILLGMLAGPTIVTTVRKLKTKSVALFVDASASMGLVDTVDGSGNISRWSPPREGSRAGGELASFDEGVATLRAAQIQWERFGKIALDSKQAGSVRELLAQSVAGIEKGLEILKAAIGALPDTRAESKAALGAALAPIENNILETVRGKSLELRRGKSLAALERSRWLPEQIGLLSAALDQTEQALDLYVQRVEQGAEAEMKQQMGPDLARSRAEKVQAWLDLAEQTWLKELRQKVVVTRYEFGDKMVPVAMEPGKKASGVKALSPTTQLGLPLQQVALESGDHPVDAAILITDGGHNQGQDPRVLAESVGATALHIVPIGNTRMQRDVLLHNTQAPKAVFLNDTVVIDSLVTAYDCAQEKLEVELLDHDQVVDRKSLAVPTEIFDSRVQLRWKAATLGRHTFAVRVKSVPGERTEDNNTTHLDVQVMEDKIRLLLADYFPRWEYRYLLNLFKRDERMEFEPLLFEPGLSRAPGAKVPSLPASLDEWARFRVVVLGDMPAAVLNSQQQKMLKEYVTELGGNLIVIGGREGMPGAFLGQPLAEILPVERGDRALPPAQPFFLQVTSEGATTLATQLADTVEGSDRIWREMSQRLPIYGLSEFSQPKPSAHSLIAATNRRNGAVGSEATDRSFLSWHYVGRGRVVYLAAPITYQLRYGRGDLYHHRFWGQLLRWAMARDLGEGAKTARLTTDKTRYEVGDPVQISLRLNQLDGRVVGGADCHLTAYQDDKVVQEITLNEVVSRPGSYEGVMERLPAGQIKLRASGSQLTFLLAGEKYQHPIETLIDLDPNGSLELRNPLCNLALLRQVADAASGLLVPPTGLPAALRQLNLAPDVEETIRKKPLWNRWDLFSIFILCLTLEWAGRKYVGLV